MKKSFLAVLIGLIFGGICFAQSLADDIEQIKAFAKRYPYVHITYVFQAQQTLALKKGKVIAPPPIGKYRFDISSTSSGNAYVSHAFDDPETIFGDYGPNDKLVRGYQCASIYGHFLGISFDFFRELSPSMRRGSTSYMESKNLNVDKYIEFFLSICDNKIPEIDF